MRLYIAIAVFLFAAVGHVAAQAPLDDLTPCSAAVRAFASKDEVKAHEIAVYVNGIFEQIDREHKRFGEPGILDKRLKGTLEAATQGLCSQHQRSTISIETAEAYRLMRSLIVGTGVEP